MSVDGQLVGFLVFFVVIVTTAIVVLVWEKFLRSIASFALAIKRKIDGFRNRQVKIPPQVKDVGANKKVFGLGKAVKAVVSRLSPGPTELELSLVDEFSTKGLDDFDSMSINTLRKLNEASQQEVEKSRAKFRKDGWFFKTMHSEDAVAPHDDGSSTEDDSLKARYFYKYDVPVVGAQFHRSYEDSEAALISQYLRFSDRPVYFELDQLRRIINSNMLSLSVMLSSIVVIVFAANFLLLPKVELLRFIGLEVGDVGPTDLWKQVNIGAISLSTCLAGWALMWLVYNLIFARCQKDNGIRMNIIVTAMLNRIKFKFEKYEREAEVAFSLPDDSARKSAAQRAIQTLLWTSSRAFFAENFVRGLIFQFARNGSYYVIFIPLLFLCVSVLTVWAIIFWGISEFHSDYYGLDNWVFYVCFVLLNLKFLNYLSQSADTFFSEIKEKNWAEFHTLGTYKAVNTTVSIWHAAINDARQLWGASTPARAKREHQD